MSILDIIDKKRLKKELTKQELEERLKNRIDQPSQEEIQLRLNRFDYEESKIKNYDYVIKNNDLEKTLAIVQTIIEKENCL